jgi:hypothetical protein
MGADLYIQSKKISKPEGYFRDPYNDSGLFAVISDTLGITLSWWRLRNRNELFNEKGEMTVEGIKTWLTELEPVMERFKAKCADRYYMYWAESLLAYLRTAVKLNAPIYWSV